ncbi:MAG: MMPL family transporter, partial [Desulfuromonadales bacterium]|nr:MMPL family transporter [Desulfuromonadales bacterium]
LHIIGFAKVVTDMTDGTGRVLMFFALAFVITTLMVYRFTRSFRITMVPLLCSFSAVIWQLGMLPILGFGIDPMGILVPFLIFAIAVSHGVQMVSACGAEVYDGVGHEEAARNSFRRLLAPGIIALASDTIGFLTIYLIDIRVIQEMAITASLGVAAVILTNLVLLPVCMSYMRYGHRYRENLHRRAEKSHVKWAKISRITQPKPAALVIGVAALLGIFGAWKGSEIKIGDMHQGIPELRQNSTYNLDSALITKKFSVGVDVLSVFAETKADGCIDFAAMDEIDRMAWHLQNVPGVQSAVSMPGVVKISNSGWNEGALGWRTMPRSQANLSQAIAYIPQSTGLRNQDCSVMPIYLFTDDHKAETINRIIDTAKEYIAATPSDKVKFTLVGNNVGVMAATNEEVDASQFPILMYVFGAVIILCLVTFRSIRATLCILIPLALVSLLGYALMAMLEIGLKVNTLPVVALGVGVGVDYGIYIYSRLESILKEGYPLRRAYEMTLDITGNGVILTGLTLGAGVATWIFSPLKFQADMGILLTFLFIVNMLGAIFLLPALACWLLPKELKQKQLQAVDDLRKCA